MTYNTNYQHLNPFVPNAPFFYPLKTSDNLMVFLYFPGVEKGSIGNKWVKSSFRHVAITSSDDYALCK